MSILVDKGNVVAEIKTGIIAKINLAVVLCFFFFLVFAPIVLIDIFVIPIILSFIALFSITIALFWIINKLANLYSPIFISNALFIMIGYRLEWLWIAYMYGIFALIFISVWTLVMLHRYCQKIIIYEKGLQVKSLIKNASFSTSEIANIYYKQEKPSLLKFDYNAISDKRIFYIDLINGRQIKLTMSYFDNTEPFIQFYENWQKQEEFKYESTKNNYDYPNIGHVVAKVKSSFFAKIFFIIAFVAMTFIFVYMPMYLTNSLLDLLLGLLLLFCLCSWPLAELNRCFHKIIVHERGLRVMSLVKDIRFSVSEIANIHYVKDGGDDNPFNEDGHILYSRKKDRRTFYIDLIDGRQIPLTMRYFDNVEPFLQFYENWKMQDLQCKDQDEAELIKHQTNQASFGKLQLECKTGKWRIFIIALCLIGIFFFTFLIAIGLQHITYFGIDGVVFLVFISLLTLIFGITVRYLWRLYSASIYENGLTLKRNLKIIELDFNEIEGIWFASYSVNIEELSMITSSSNTAIKIFKKDGTKPIIFRVTKFKKFAQVFSSAFTKHLLKDLNYENIDQANISFGKYLKLENGNFIHQSGNEKSKMVIPFDAISDIEFKLEVITHGSLILKDANTPENQIIAPLEHVINLDTLYHIVKKL